MEVVPKMVPIQHKTPVFLGFLLLIAWKVVPGGGIEPLAQDFLLSLYRNGSVSTDPLCNEPSGNVTLTGVP
jgi:hypothetical protein